VQEREMLNSIRQSWVQYLTLNPQIDLLAKDKDGEIIYNNTNGTSIAYDPDSMTLKRVDDSYYDIYDKSTDKLLAKSVRPAWNEQELSKIIAIVITPLKAFGPTGEPLVYDAFTGEILVDNSRSVKEVPSILQPDGKRNVKLYYKHPNCKNPSQVNDIVTSQLLWRKDSDSTSHITSLYLEPTAMTDPNDFAKYPLGKYHRNFLEKIILPYESVGVDGQEMQISVVIGAQEQEIMSGFKEAVKGYDSIEGDLYNRMNQGVLYPIISIGLSLLIIFFAMFFIRLHAYQCKECAKKAPTKDE
jgi:hypothetical protein